MFHHLEQPGSVHVPYNWVYPDYATMVADTGFVPVDVGKLALEQDNNTLWMLTSTTPTWQSMGGVAPASTYEEGGPDPLDVAGLSGVLAEPQTPAFHHVTHEAGGSDQVDINGLLPRIVSGIILADPSLNLPAHPVTIRVTFDVPFVDNQYAVVAQIVDGDGDYKPLRVLNKTAAGFSLVINGDGATKFCDIDFLAKEALVEEFGGYGGSSHQPSSNDFTVGFDPEFTLYADPASPLIADYTGHPGSAVDYDFSQACYAEDPLDGHIDNFGETQRIPVNTEGLGDRMTAMSGNVIYSCTNSRGQTIQKGCLIELTRPPLPDGSEVKKTPHYVWAKGFGRPQFNGLYKLTTSNPFPQYQQVADPSFVLEPLFMNGHFEWYLWQPSTGLCYHGSDAPDWNQEPVGRDYEPNDGGSVVHTQYELSDFGLTPESINVNGGPYIFDHYNFDGSGNPTGAVYIDGTNSVVDNFNWVTNTYYDVLTTGSGFYNEGDDPTTTWFEQWGGGDPEPSAAATQEEP
jgi:hypothetical protein